MKEECQRGNSPTSKNDIIHMVGDYRVILGKVIVLFPNTRKARYFIQALERKYSILQKNQRIQRN